MNRRINEFWRNGSVEMIVAEVGAEEVTMVINEMDSSQNLTRPVAELVAEMTTLAALLNSFHPSEIDILSYEAEVRPYEGGSWAVISERSEYEFVGGGNTSSERVVDLSHFVLLETATTIVDVALGAEIQETRTLVSLEGISPLKPEGMTTQSFDLPRGEVTFQLFGRGEVNGVFGEGTFSLDIVLDEPALLASVLGSDVFSSILEEDIELDNLLWHLNETHSLLIVQLLPGQHRISFQVGGQLLLAPHGSSVVELEFSSRRASALEASEIKGVASRDSARRAGQTHP
ncbi:MAG: hypothetical protein ACE5LS_05900 [Thermoplasmata archaeon]